MSNSEHKQQLQVWDELIKMGKSEEIKSTLHIFSPSRVPEEYAAKYANIFNRIGLPDLSIRLLLPFVRPEVADFVEASIDQKYEYAIALNLIGSHNEAWELMHEGFDESPPAKILFCRAQIMISQWNYSEAGSILQDYIQCEEISNYQRSIGKVNLAASYVTSGKNKKAQSLLGEIIPLLVDQDYKLLAGNCEELLAQIYIHDKNFNKAREALNKAESMLSQSRSKYSFFVKKWHLILQMAENPDSEDFKQNLYAFKDEAKVRRSWESVREADLQYAAICGAERYFEKVFFGSPYESYRHRILELCGSHFSIPAKFKWVPFNGPKNLEGPYIDLKTGKLNDNQKVLAPGETLHNLFSILTTDFYRPQPMALIFSKLYKNEFFNPHSSPGRVHQVIWRLRDRFRELGIPLSVEEVNGQYRMTASDSISIQVKLNRKALSKNEIQLAKLKEKFSTKEFSSVEAREHLGVSLATMSRLVNWAIGEDLVTKRGSGKNTRYCISL